MRMTAVTTSRTTYLVSSNSASEFSLARRPHDRVRPCPDDASRGTRISNAGALRPSMRGGYPEAARIIAFLPFARERSIG